MAVDPERYAEVEEILRNSYQEAVRLDIMRSFERDALEFYKAQAAAKKLGPPMKFKDGEIVK